MAERKDERVPLLRDPPHALRGIGTAGGLLRIIGYALGTVQNDMTASLWFAFLLFSLEERGVSPGGAATVILSGQIADALFTPFAGHLSDGTKSRFGKRRPWIVGGALVVGLSFIFIFSPVPGPVLAAVPAGWRQLFEVIYFSTLASVFNFGWASVQVAHMALVPELSSDDFVRLRLNSFRFAFTVASNLAVFGLAWLGFQWGHLLGATTRPDQLRLTACAAVALGALGVLICALSVSERPSNAASEAAASGPDAKPAAGPSRDPHPVVWKEWFGVVLFYEVGVVYMAARMVVVFSQVAMPFFLVYRLHLDSMSLALVPLLVQLASLLGSFWVPYVNRPLGLKAGYCGGAALCIAAAAAFYFLESPPGLVYPSALVLGLGTAGVAVTAMMLEAVVVGEHTDSAAFVYGFYGFLEKLSGGIAIFILNPYLTTSTGSAWAMSAVPAGASLLSFALLVLAVRLPAGQHSLRREADIEAAKEATAGDVEAHSLAGADLEAAKEVVDFKHPRRRLPRSGPRWSHEDILPSREYFAFSSFSHAMAGKATPYHTWDSHSHDWETAASITSACL